MQDELTIVLVLQSGGDFHFSDVELLNYHIQRTTPNVRVLCLMDTIKNPEKLTNGLTLLSMHNNTWPGWWSKINLFAPEMEQYRPFAFMDLDTAVVGNLRDAFPEKGLEDKFVTLANCYELTRPGSGIMWIPANSEKIRTVWQKWMENPEKSLSYYRQRGKGGDQNFIESTNTVDAFFSFRRMNTFKPNPKREWRAYLDPELRIVYFHGYPRPKEAFRINWVRDYVYKQNNFSSIEMT